MVSDRIKPCIRHIHHFRKKITERSIYVVMFQIDKKDRKPILKYHWKDCSSILLPLVTLAYKL